MPDKTTEALGVNFMLFIIFFAFTTPEIWHLASLTMDLYTWMQWTENGKILGKSDSRLLTDVWSWQIKGNTSSNKNC